MSIIIPVYNEKDTFKECFEQVLNKEIKGVDKEIVIVESSSTDGTRELVQRVSTIPGVKVIFQDRPRGKGNAVRAGLQAISGDIVLIQDADLEYDVNDYDTLVQPILNNKAAFVLGSRHTGNWKMREFNNEPMTATIFNFGHIIFRGLLNLLYGQSLKDPFTMYKVFRTECLQGLHLECNRFDFDFEIVIKLIRKGFVPWEVPVNYKARSFKEGKKVSFWRDPWTWLWTLTKYRFCPIADSTIPISNKKNQISLFFSSMLRSILHYIASHHSQLVKFVLVGFGTFVFNFSVFYLFYKLTHLDYRIAMSLSYVLSIIVHFSLNRLFTFEARYIIHSVWKYGLMLGLNYVVTLIIAWFIVEVLGHSPSLAITFTMAIMALMNFFMMKYFVFKSRAT